MELFHFLLLVHVMLHVQELLKKNVLNDQANIFGPTLKVQFYRKHFSLIDVWFEIL